MAHIEVTAKKGAREITTNYDFGDSLAQAVELFGEEVVFSNMRQSMKISLQALIRRGIEKGQSDEEIIAAAAAWKPGVASERQSNPVAAVLSKWATLDDATKAELLKKLKTMQA